MNEHPETQRLSQYMLGNHGPYFGAMTAMAQEKIHGGFDPLPPGFIFDLDRRSRTSKIRDW